MGARDPRAKPPKYVSDEAQIQAGVAAFLAAESARIRATIQPASEKAFASGSDRDALMTALLEGERRSRSAGGSAAALFSAQVDAIIAAGFRRGDEA